MLERVSTPGRRYVRNKSTHGSDIAAAAKNVSQWTLTKQRDGHYLVRNARSGQHAYVIENDRQFINGMAIVENGERAWRLTWEDQQVRYG